MNVIISGHRLEVTPFMHNYVVNRMDRLIRHFDQLVDIKILLRIENKKDKGGRQIAEGNIHIKGHDLYVHCADADLYAAVDSLVDKLDRKVSEFKIKLKNHHHQAPKRLM